ncbi:MAG: NAD-dependent epimerase/dehydratase family protein [Planctomycetes bacterium]|nr:NAD-dependent epimerase/dehydratase family protein [Planctomycetota bacterium]
MILVTGGAGVIGSRLVRRLADSGRKVRAMILPGDPNALRLEGAGCETVEGDVTRPETVTGAMTGVNTVYHLAAVVVSKDAAAFRRVNEEGTRNVLAAAAAAGAGHFVYVSSASVTYPGPTEYSESKRRAEEAVRSEKRLQHTIVRPTLVYGRTGGQEIEMFRRFIRWMPLVPIVGTGRALKRPVFAEDVIEGLAAIAGNSVTYGKTYNFSGGETITVRRLVRILGRGMGLYPATVAIPEFAWRAAAWMLGLLGSPALVMNQGISGLGQDANLDPSEAIRDLGYCPRPAGSGIPECFRGTARRGAP